MICHGGQSTDGYMGRRFQSEKAYVSLEVFAYNDFATK